MSKKALDGMSNNPAYATTAITKYIDWQTLKREFLIQTEYSSPQQWLHSVKGWNPKKIKSGNTLEKITGWGNERATIQQRMTDAAIEKALELERKRVPELRAAKAQLIANIIKDVGRWDRLNAYDKKLCYEIMKVELREPTNVKDLPPAGARDPVEALLEEYGLMLDGEIIDDEPDSDKQLVSGADSTKTAKADSRTSAEVSQD